MTTPTTPEGRFIVTLRELEVLVNQYPELLEPSRGYPSDLFLLLDYVKRHAAARAEVLGHLVATKSPDPRFSGLAPPNK